MKKYLRIWMFVGLFALAGIFVQTSWAGDDVVTFDDDDDVVAPEKKGEKKLKKKSKDASKSEAKDKASKSDSDDKQDADSDEEEQKPEDDFELNASLEGKYAEMAELGRVAAKTQKKILRVQISQERTLRKFDRKSAATVARYQKKIDKARDDKVVKKYQKKLDAIEREKVKIEQKHEYKALKLLSKEEMMRRNAAMLWDGISQDLTMLNVSDEQRKLSREACNAYAAKLKGKPLSERNIEKATLKVSKQLMKTVLDKTQKKEYKRFLIERMRKNRKSK